jgi:hypothetical protein
MFTRQLVMVVAGGLLMPPLAESASPASPVDVTARLYNTARIPAVARDAALSVAAGALLAGGIGLRWKNCDIADSCAMVPARGELVIRLVRSPGQIVTPRDPSVARTRRSLGEGGSGPRVLVLGEAFIDTRERAGVLATVFVDHVELIAALSETDAALLLGRAIAHELGHLLLGSNAHSVRGLMRAQWTPADIRRHASADWALTTEDAAAIRRRLQ